VNTVNSGKIDFERDMSSTPAVTIALIAVNALIFFITAGRGMLQSESAILRAGALSHALVLHGEVWRLLSAMFLHGSLEHLIGNGVGLIIVGMAAEHAYGRLEMTGIYFISGLTGSIFSVLLNPGPAVGASGAIFGILGATIVFFFKYHDRLHIRDKRVGNAFLIWAGYSIVTAYFIPFVDNAAHVGGIIGGAFSGYWWSPRLMRDESSQSRARIA
jgi:rhomboid protease GluP